MLYKNNKFKISTPTWNAKLELPDDSYALSNIQDNFKSLKKKKRKHGEKTINPSIKICENKIGNVITIKIKKGYYLEFL